MIAFVTGAASSGKSAFAESLAQRLAAAGPREAGPSGTEPAPLIYLATMEPFGEEGARRIARHRALREGKGFRTWEVPRDLAQAVFGAATDPPEAHHQPASQAADRTGACRGNALATATVLLEDLGNLVANEMFRESPDVAATVDSVVGGIAELGRGCENLVIVGNEVGADGIAYAPETAAYIRALGACSCAIAPRADFTAEVVAGVPNVLKGTMP